MLNSEFIKNLEEMIRTKNVRKSLHANGILSIYSYTKQCQFDKNWNSVTLMCRGLILDNNMNIVALPYEKFFNLQEHLENPVWVWPGNDYEIYTKMDGSLIIATIWNNEIIIATPGSFVSEQCEYTRTHLLPKYTKGVNNMKPGYTYLFECIYPENRIVVSYDEPMLVLTGIRNNTTGEYLPLEDIGFPICKKWPHTNIDVLRNTNISNFEGFVLKWPNGFRLKVKLDEYVKLHYTRTQISTYTIWNALREEKFTELIENIPDEIYSNINYYKQQIETNFKQIENSHKLILNEILSKYSNILDIVSAIKNYEKYSSSLLFFMWKNKKYDKIIWNMVKPVYKILI